MGVDLRTVTFLTPDAFFLAGALVVGVLAGALAVAFLGPIIARRVCRCKQ